MGEALVRMRPCDCGCGRPVMVQATEEAAKVYHMKCLEEKHYERREERDLS